MTEYSPVTRFKWQLLNAGANRQDIGVAYGFAGDFLEGATNDELYGLVRVAVLELVDEGFLQVFVAPFPEGFDLELAATRQIDREELSAWLSSPEDPPAESETETLWFVDTDAGDDEWRRLRSAGLA